MSEAIVMAAEGIQKTFAHPAGPVEVIKSATLALKRGEMAAVLGRSGAGKSTLLHILGTLDSPTAGRVFFEGEDLSRMSDEKLSVFRNRHLGFVFQFHYLLPEFTALENVLMPAWIAGQEGATSEGRARELLAVMGLTHRLSHRPTELSGGEQQRVALARALMMNPEVIFTDELTGNLDAHTGEEVMQYLVKINREFQVTVLSVTHHQAMAETNYQTLYTMKDGHLSLGAPSRP